MSSTFNSIKLLNTAEAADLLGLKKTTLEIWRWRGCGPAYKKIGRAVRYAEKDLHEYLEQQTCRSTSGYAN